MFKRMSLLSRRAGDDRSHFAEHWQAHGNIIARLPGLRGYIQNHVTAEVDGAKLGADGIVELWFDSPGAMADAFASPIARRMADDEPGFLGRATGYALADPAGSDIGLAARPKLIIADVDGKFQASEVAALATASHLTAFDVTTVIAKAGQLAPPMPVRRFLIAGFADHAGLSRAVAELKSRPARGWSAHAVEGRRLR